MNHRDRVALVSRRAGDGVDTQVTHAADHHQFLDAIALQHRRQFGVAKRVDEMLENHLLVGTVEDLGVQLSPFGTGDKKRRIGARGLVADMHHQVARLTGGGQNRGGLVGRRIGAAQGPFSAREIVILDIHQDQRLYGHIIFLD